jgi:hypothetical protein
MNDNRLGAIALIAGTLWGLITLIAHPGGVSLHNLTPAQFEKLVTMIIGVHVVAMAGLPFLCAGGLTFSRHIRSTSRLEWMAFIIFSFGLAATMIAVTVSGLVAPEIFRQLRASAEDSNQWVIVMMYSHIVNQSFARISAITYSIAIVLWSLTIIRRCGRYFVIGIYGLFAGLGVLFGLWIDAIDLELRGFRVITLSQAIWFIGAAILLWRCTADLSPERNKEAEIVRP